MSYPSEKEFLQLTAKGNLIPIYKEIAGDLDTPVSAYYKLSKKAKYSFLLESVEGEEKIARYSFLACNPDLILQSKNKKLQVTDFTAKKANVTTQTIDQNPLKYI
ncbi:MAG: anthranilate synthase component I, partial [Candidatus Omnitrophica bacterium]|nr:anthranilate synthase component I [Candidatus Omnitrophota bacterium]